MNKMLKGILDFRKYLTCIGLKNQSLEKSKASLGTSIFSYKILRILLKKLLNIFQKPNMVSSIYFRYIILCYLLFT